MNIVIEPCGPAQRWLGPDRITLTLPADDARVDDALDALAELHPAFAERRHRCAVALDDAIVAGHTPLTTGAVLSVIPPVSGG